MEKIGYVYILASGRYCTLYIGVTSDLVRRVWQHRAALAPGFTSRYAVKKLVWYEQHGDIVTAIAREKQLKKWRRDWKIELIQRTNPLWHDLYADIVAFYRGLYAAEFREVLWIPAFAAVRRCGMTARAFAGMTASACAGMTGSRFRGGLPMRYDGLSLCGGPAMRYDV